MTLLMLNRVCVVDRLMGLLSRLSPGDLGWMDREISHRSRGAPFLGHWVVGLDRHPAGLTSQRCRGGRVDRLGLVSGVSGTRPLNGGGVVGVDGW
jgi:hypothetical protein